MSKVSACVASMSNNQLRDFFRLYDDDKSGVLSIDEFLYFLNDVQAYAEKWERDSPGQGPPEVLVHRFKPGTYGQPRTRVEKQSVRAVLAVIAETVARLYDDAGVDGHFLWTFGGGGVRACASAPPGGSWRGDGRVLASACALENKYELTLTD